MVTIPPIKMVMTGGWFMTLFYPHYNYKAIPVSSIFGQHDSMLASSNLLTSLMVKLVEAPEQPCWTPHQAEPNFPLGDSHDLALPSTSQHFPALPVQFRWCRFMISMAWHQVFFIPQHGKSWHVCSLSLWVLLVFIFIFLGVLAYVSLSCPSISWAVFTVHASTRPCSDARDITW